MVERGARVEAGGAGLATLEQTLASACVDLVRGMVVEHGWVDRLEPIDTSATPSCPPVPDTLAALAELFRGDIGAHRAPPVRPPTDREALAACRRLPPELGAATEAWFGWQRGQPFEGGVVNDRLHPSLNCAMLSAAQALAARSRLLADTERKQELEPCDVPLLVSPAGDYDVLSLAGPDRRVGAGGLTLADAVARALVTAGRPADRGPAARAGA